DRVKQVALEAQHQTALEQQAAGADAVEATNLREAFDASSAVRELDLHAVAEQILGGHHLVVFAAIHAEPVTPAVVADPLGALREAEVRCAVAIGAVGVGDADAGVAASAAGAP